jgi:hypothetical protein
MLQAIYKHHFTCFILHLCLPFFTPSFDLSLLSISVLTYLFVYLPTYLPTYLPAYLPTYLPAYLSIYLPTYLSTYLLTYLLTYLPIYLPTYLSIHPSIYLLICVYLSIHIYTYLYKLLYSQSGIAQWYSAGLRAGWSGVRVPAGAANCSLHYRVQTDSGAHPSSYPMGTTVSFLAV